ncbi:MAG: anti-sigma factor, partial [Bacteroidota bacterium]
MIPDREQFEELCAAYALGALEEEERALFEEGLKNGGKEYKKIFEESIGVSYLINSSVKKELPSPAVKTKLMEKIRGNERRFSSLSSFVERTALAVGFGNPRFGFAIALLLLAMVVEVGTFAYLMYLEAERNASQTAMTQSGLQQRLLALQDELDQKNEILNILQSRVLEVVVMNGLEVNPQGYGKIIWDPQRNIAILQVSKLPSVSSDKDYQLW